MCVSLQCMVEALDGAWRLEVWSWRPEREVLGRGRGPRRPGKERNQKSRCKMFYVLSRRGRARRGAGGPAP